VGRGDGQGEPMTQYSNEEINELVVETIYELADFENPPELVFAQLLPLVHDEHALAAAVEIAVTVLGSHLPLLRAGGGPHSQAEVREWSAITPSSVRFVDSQRLEKLLSLTRDAKSQSTGPAVRSIVRQAQRECGDAYGAMEVLLTAVLAAAGAQRERRLREALDEDYGPYSRFRRQRVLCHMIERVFFEDVSPRMAAERLAAVSPAGPAGRGAAAILREALSALGALLFELGRIGGAWDPAAVVTSTRASGRFDWDDLAGQLVDAPLDDLLQAAVFIGAGHVGGADGLIAGAEQQRLVWLLTATLALTVEAVDRVRMFDAAGAEWAWRHVPRQGIERLNNLTDGPPTELREGTTWSHEWTVSYAGKTQLIRAHAQVCGGSLHPAVEAYGLDETDDGNDWELLSCGVPLDHLLHAGRTRNHDHECD
jgi:hypothetical protein